MAAGKAHSIGFRARGWIGGLALAPLLPFVILSVPVVSEDSWFDPVFDVIAWVVFVAGATFRFWGTLYIGGRKDAIVVDIGPYSLCRHPLYLGSLLLASSAGLFLKSLTFAAGITTAMLAYAALTIPAEERWLTAQFGERYLDYSRRVPRLWPFRSHFGTPSKIEVDVEALWTEFRRSTRWLLLPMFGEVIAHLRVQPWWPRLFQLP